MSAAFHYVKDGKPFVSQAPIFYFAWTYGSGHVTFGMHGTQAEFDASSLLDKAGKRELVTRQQLAEINPDAKALTRHGILYESNGFYVFDAKRRNRFEVYAPGTTAAHCVGFRAKDEPNALERCKRTVDRLARYPRTVTP